MLKTTNKKYALINETLTFNIEIVNNSNIVLNNVFFQDILEPELSFVDRSVKVNGVCYDSFNPNTGFNLNNINPGSITIVTFQAIVKKYLVILYLKIVHQLVLIMNYQ